MSTLIESPPAPATPGSVLDQPAPAPEGLPEWFTARRTAAWQRFQDLPLPERTNEKWRFSRIKEASLEGFTHAAEPASLADPHAEHVLDKAVARLAFHNGHLVSADLPENQSGLTVMPLEQALRECPDLIEAHFMKSETPLGSEKFAALHEANALSGVFIHAAKGTAPEDPVEIVHYFSGCQGAHFPHTLVVGEDNAEVTVIEHFVSLDEESAFVIGVSDLAADGAARVRHAMLQRLSTSSKAILINTTSAGRDADAKSLLLNLGGAWVRTESVSHVTGTGANVNLLSASIPGTGQEFDQRTYQIHKAQHTTSDLLYKNALFDKARTIFSGLIIVDDGAHHTDAYQTCRNLLMSDHGEAHSLPGLEIKADQVKCSHGSTTAQIDPDTLLYLKARGIHDKTARKLITYGFIEEVVERFGHEAAGRLLDRFIEEKFKALGA